MKRWLVLAVAAIAIAGFSTVSLAAIQGSHHDMRAFTGTGDACYACHGIKTDAGTLANAGQVGSLCWVRCHIGSGPAGDITGLTNAQAEFAFFDTATNAMARQAYTPVGNKYTTGHQFLVTPGAVPVPDAGSDVTNTGWPYTGAAEIMQCTSCHDVHSNAYTPFIRAPLSDNAAQASAFCQRCHAASADGAARWVNITAAPNGSHPSEVGDWSTAAATRNTNGRRERRLLLKDTVAADNNAVFRNVSPWGTALNSASSHYNPGGKLGGPQAMTFSPASGGVIGCYTCHATHIPATGTTPGRGQLLVAPYTGRVVSDLCVGCHGGNTTNDNTNVASNPGVTAYFHPVGTDSRPVNVATLASSTWQVTTGAFNITVNLDNTGITASEILGTSNLLLCTSCHGVQQGSATSTQSSGVHAGPAGTMILNPQKPTCESCHNTTAAVTGLVPNSHHVYGGGSAQYTRYSGYGYPATVNYGSYTANLADGLQCNDCHIFNSTAHNWN